MASALDLVPIRWVLTAIEFSPVCTAFRVSPVCCVLIALELSSVLYEVGTRCPLVASFLFVLMDVEPCEECSSL